MSTIETMRPPERARPEQTGSARSSAHRATIFSLEPAEERREARSQAATTAFRSFGRRTWHSHRQPDRLPQTAQGSLTEEGAGGFSSARRPMGARPRFLAEAWQTCNHSCFCKLEPAASALTLDRAVKPVVSGPSYSIMIGLQQGWTASRAAIPGFVPLSSSVVCED